MPRIHENPNPVCGGLSFFADRFSVKIGAERVENRSIQLWVEVVSKLQITSKDKARVFKKHSIHGSM
jgi:hypothetical protein